MTTKQGESEEPQADELFGYDTLERLLGDVPRGTLWCWVAQKRIPYVRLGPRTVRFRRRDILDWLSRKSVKEG